MKKWYFIFSFTIIILVLSLTYYKNTTNPKVLSVYDENTSFFEKFIPLTPKAIRQRKFNEVIKRTKEKEGVYGIYIKEIGGSLKHTFNQDELFYGASLYKIPLGAAALKEIELGNKRSDELVEIQGNDFEDGTGSLNTLYPGVEIEYNQILNTLLKESDNTAQNIFWRILPMDQIMAAFNIITIKTYFYVNNTVTPTQIGNLFENIILGDYLSDVSKEILLNKMSITVFDDRVHKGLNEDIKFAHKIGNWPETSSWHDCGITVKDESKIVVCVMSRNTTYEDFLSVTKDVGEYVNILF
ncbi:serine hydrolase [Patescibacteria group bacterium]